MSWRAYLGLLLLLAYCLPACERLLTDPDIFKPNYRHRDELALCEEQLGKLRPMLPRQGVVGCTPAHPDRQTLYLTQHILCPLVVAEDDRHPLLIGNYNRPPRELVNSAGQRYQLAADLGDGVQLYRQGDR